MTTTRYHKIASWFLSVFFSLPIGLTALVIYFGPSPLDIQSSSLLSLLTIPLLVEFPLSCIMYRKILLQKEGLPFSLLLGGTGLVLIVGSIFLGTAINRDFFNAAFQYTLSLPAVYLYHIWFSRETDMEKKTLRTVSRAGYVLAVLYAEWIMLMGYAIATRAEPRPVEALIYNVFNLALVLLLFLSSRRIGIKSLHTVSLARTSLQINDRDFSSIFGAHKIALLHAFASAPQRTLRCLRIQIFLNVPEADSFKECAECNTAAEAAAKTHDATKKDCPRYQAVSLSIQEIKKLLEYFEIGTITAPLTDASVLTDGWKLILFENVRIDLAR